MRILAIRPTAGGKTLAVFDVEISEHLRIYNLLLRSTPAGARTIAPKAAGKHAASFHPVLAEQISAAAVAALGGRAANAEH
ncbi:hypothetical protein LA66_13970 [Aureimonas altamirensis]|uniref:Uncharacterized protein n=1 Tax=Aureimonas altamirensis TaxID=370622 RepID=A0A0B1Q579_9HYPH|nr:hypothetical protein LA66_13970 [Aureimonas altamirensis]